MSQESFQTFIWSRTWRRDETDLCLDTAAGNDLKRVLHRESVKYTGDGFMSHIHIFYLKDWEQLWFHFTWKHLYYSLWKTWGVKPEHCELKVQQVTLQVHISAASSTPWPLWFYSLVFQIYMQTIWVLSQLKGQSFIYPADKSHGMQRVSPKIYTETTSAAHLMSTNWTLNNCDAFTAPWEMTSLHL